MSYFKMVRIGFTCIMYANMNLVGRYFGLQPIPTQQHLLMPLGNKPFENTVGKGEIARNEQFLLYPQCFLPI